MIGGFPVSIVNARELHSYLENGDLFANWIKLRIDKYEFTENVDFSVALVNAKAKSGGQNKKDYLISLDMAKELSMVENNAKGREARRYFIAMERKALEGAGQSVPVGRVSVETLEPSEQQTLMEIVKAKVAHLPTGEQGKPIAEIWSRVHHKFRVAKYSQLPRTQLSEAILYVTGMELKSAKAKPADPLCTQEQRSELAKLTARIGGHAHMSKSLAWAVSNRMRTELGVSSTLELKASQYQAAVSFLGTMDSLVSSFRSRVIGIEKQFCRMIVRDGSPDAVAEFEATFSGEMKQLFTDAETRPLLT
jgi:phage anti-repressor protein